MTRKGAILVFAVYLLCLTSAPVFGWVTEVVDRSKEGGHAGNSSIVMDSDGNAHVASCNLTLNALQYSTNRLGSWTTEMVDSPRSLLPLGDVSDTSIALDSEGAVHICYADRLFYNHRLMYATNRSGGWEVTTLDEDTGGGCSPSIVVDAEDRVHISYRSKLNSTYRLGYATNTSGTWETVNVASEGGACSSIGLDRSGNVHISHYLTQPNLYDGTDYYLEYTTNASGSWLTTSLGKAGSLGPTDTLYSYTSIALDSMDRVHIASHGYQALRHLTNASGSWVTTTVDSTGYKPGDASLGIDGFDNIHIAYQDSDGDYLKYATNASGSWVVESLYDSDSYRTGVSLALDGENHIHISHEALVDAYNLAYTTNVSGVWSTELLQCPGALSGTMTLDDSGGVHVAYGSQHNYSLWYATNASGAWVSLQLDAGNHAGRYSSIDVDAAGMVHIGHVDVNNDYLEYITNASGSWISEPVGVLSSWWYPTIVAADTEEVYVSCSYKGDGLWHFGYFTNISGSWELEEVAPHSYSYEMHGSIALDADGYLHSSYCADDMFVYATNAGGSWTQTPIASGYNSFNSVALDPAGHAHVAYRDWTNDSVTYASNVTGTWETTFVDAAGYLGTERALALDAAGAAYIAYVDLNRTLKVATNANGSWTSETACDGFLGSGEHASIGISEEGVIYVTHKGRDGTLLLTSGAIPCRDHDEDGYGSPSSPLCVYPARDCEDADPAINPGAAEIPGNGVDDDCDPSTPDQPAYPPNSHAALYGADSVTGSGVLNQILLVLIPIGAVIFLRILRRRT